VNKVFIFDLDDTLYWNMHDYCYQILEFEKFILDKLEHRAPHVSKIMKLLVETGHNLFDKINPKTGVIFGYSRDRFPETLIQTYKIICTQAKAPISQRAIEKIYKIGMKAFNVEHYKKKGLVEGAKELLDFLKEKQDKLILLTQGDERVQRPKIDALNLMRWFSDVYIIPFKTQGAFKKIKSRFYNKYSKIYSIGNNFKSDVELALKIGLLGIYVPYQYWFSKDSDEKNLQQRIDQKQVFVFEEIIEIKKNYRKL